MAETVDTAGKAVAFSALTVLASLAAILIVPSPAFRSMAFGIMLSVVAVLAATLTLLAGRPREARDQHQQGSDPTAPRGLDPRVKVGSTGCCTPGGSSSGATRSPRVRRP